MRTPRAFKMLYSPLGPNASMLTRDSGEPVKRLSVPTLRTRLGNSHIPIGLTVDDINCFRTLDPLHPLQPRRPDARRKIPTLRTHETPLLPYHSGTTLITEPHFSSHNQPVSLGDSNETYATTRTANLLHTSPSQISEKSDIYA